MQLNLTESKRRSLFSKKNQNYTTQNRINHSLVHILDLQTTQQNHCPDLDLQTTEQRFIYTSQKRHTTCDGCFMTVSLVYSR
jgi:hypothetical protein